MKDPRLAQVPPLKSDCAAALVNVATPHVILWTQLVFFLASLPATWIVLSQRVIQHRDVLQWPGIHDSQASCMSCPRVRFSLDDPHLEMTGLVFHLILDAFGVEGVSA